MRKINWQPLLAHTTEALSAFGSRGKTFFAIAVVLFTWWLAGALGPHEAPQKKVKTGRVDYFTKGLRRTVMGEDGNPKEHLVADEMLHYEDEDTAVLFRPVITLFVKQGPPWIINSETAKIPGNSEFIFMNGDVLVEREAHEDSRAIRIETTNVRTIPDKDYAETDEYIRVISPPDYMTGTGATINFGHNLNYRILHDVRRRHDVETETTNQ
jgi:lipopolysaccharide export system protein LptC